MPEPLDRDNELRKLIIKYFRQRAQSSEPVPFDEVVGRSRVAVDAMPADGSDRGRILFAAVAAIVVLVAAGAGYFVADGLGRTENSSATAQATTTDDAEATDLSPEDSMAEVSPTTIGPRVSTTDEVDSGPTNLGGVVVDDDGPVVSTETQPELDFGPYESFVAIGKDGVISRISRLTGDVVEVVARFEELAESNRGSLGLIEGQARSEYPGGIAPDGGTSDVLLAVCCEPVGGNVYKLTADAEPAHRTPVAVGTRAVPASDGSAVAFAIPGYGLIVDRTDTGIEWRYEAEIAWLQRDGSQLIAWVEIHETLDASHTIWLKQIEPRGSQPVELTSVDLSRLTIASDGDSRLVLAGCGEPCTSTELVMVNTSTGDVTDRALVEYSALLGGVSPSGQLLLTDDDGVVHIITGLGDQTRIVDEPVASDVLWAGW